MSTKTYFHRTQLSQEKINLLEEIKFVWDQSFEKLWNQKYEDLLNYFDKEGHSSVPQSTGTLGSWVNKQRSDYKKIKSQRKELTY